jgi:hypothetical protein
MNSDDLEPWEVAAQRLDETLAGKAPAELLNDMARELAASGKLPPMWNEKLCILLAYDYLQTQLGAVELKVDPYALWVQRQQAREIGTLLVHFGLKTQIGKGADELELAYRALAKQQQAKARKPRGPVDVAEIIKELARHDESAKALWPTFIGRLSDDGYETAESETGKPAVTYRPRGTSDSEGKSESMTLKTFSNRISEERNKKSR